MSTSYLEQYLDSLDSLPIELQRNFTLMRELDSRAQDVMKTIDRVAEDYLDNMKHYSKDKRKETLNEIQKYFDKTKEFGDDKVQLAIQTYEMVDKYIRKLDTDLARFEQEIQEKAIKNTTSSSSAAGASGAAGAGASKSKRGRKKAKDKADSSAADGGAEESSKSSKKKAGKKSSTVKLEVCVDSVASALAAVDGGADRLELCAALSEGGLTPTVGLYKVIKSLVLVPVFVMIRPRAGFDFVYDQTERDIMLTDCRQFVDLGADGFVIGALTSDQQIDIGFIRQLVDIIGDRPITFHRAFDVVKDPVAALQELMGVGKISRVLTSGQRRSVIDGLPLLHQLQELAAGRIIIMPGSGVTPQNVLSILKPTHNDIVPRFSEIHLSGKQSVVHRFPYENEVCAGDKIEVTDARVIREVRRIVDELVAETNVV